LAGHSDGHYLHDASAGNAGILQNSRHMDSSSIQSATLRPCSASVARKVNMTKDIKLTLISAVSETENLNLSFERRRIIFHVSDAENECNVCFSFCLGMGPKNLFVFIFWLPFS
jgi:hypothetical protein